MLVNNKTLGALGVTITSTRDGAITGVYDSVTRRGYDVEYGSKGIRSQPVRNDFGQQDYDFLHMLRGATPENIAHAKRKGYDVRSFCEGAYVCVCDGCDHPSCAEINRQ